MECGHGAYPGGAHRRGPPVARRRTQGKQPTCHSGRFEGEPDPNPRIPWCSPGKGRSGTAQSWADCPLNMPKISAEPWS
ncbi:hypothetical protein [Azospirillum argentinense]